MANKCKFLLAYELYMIGETKFFFGRKTYVKIFSTILAPLLWAFTFLKGKDIADKMSSSSEQS